MSVLKNLRCQLTKQSSCKLLTLFSGRNVVIDLVIVYILNKRLFSRGNKRISRQYWGIWDANLLTNQFGFWLIFVDGWRYHYWLGDRRYSGGEAVEVFIVRWDDTVTDDYKSFLHLTVISLQSKESHCVARTWQYQKWDIAFTEFS